MSGKGGGRLDQRNQKMMTAIYHWPCWIVFLLLLFAPALTHTTTHLKLHFRMNSCLSSYSPPLLPLCIIRVFSRYMMILIIILYNQSRLLVFFFIVFSLLFILSFSAPLPFYCIKKNNSVRILLDIFFTCVYGRVSGAFHVRKHYIKRLKTTKNRCVFFFFSFWHSFTFLFVTRCEYVTSSIFCAIIRNRIKEPWIDELYLGVRLYRIIWNHPVIYLHAILSRRLRFSDVVTRATRRSQLPLDALTSADDDERKNKCRLSFVPKAARYIVTFKRFVPCSQPMLPESKIYE